MYLSDLEITLSCFARAHRDNRVNRRFSTKVTGGSGIGKTEIIKKIGTDLDMAVVISHVAQLEPGELLGIPRSVEIRKGLTVQRYDLPGYLPHYLHDDNGQVVSKLFEDGIYRKVIDVDLLGSKVKNRRKLEEKHGDKWQEHVKGVIIFLDEINRAVGDDTKQAIFELPGDYALHEYEVPENCVVFAAENPSTGDYQVNDMDQEKAWVGRFVNLKAEGRLEDSIAYFRQNHMEESIISFVTADESALMEIEQPFEIQARRSPRSYEIVDNILKYVDLPEKDSIRREVFMGILGNEYGNTFTNHLKNNIEEVPSSPQIVCNYNAVRPFIQQVIAENNIALLNQTVRQMEALLITEEQVMHYFWTKDDNGNTIPNDMYIDNLIHYLSDLPSEVRMALVRRTTHLDWVNDILGSSDVIVNIMQADFHAAKSDIHPSQPS